MIAFDKSLLDNTFLVDEANSLADSGFIKLEKAKAIAKEIPALKTNDNLLIRIMMFLLGAFLYGSICGFLALLSIDGLDNHWKILIVIFAIVGFVGQEFVLAKSSNMFGYGLDDAAILGAILATAFFVAEGSDSQNLTISMVIAIASIFTYFRYLHLPSAIIACLSITASLFFSLIDYCQYGQQIMPFVMMLFAGIIYFFTSNKLKNINSPYYKNGLLVLKCFSLLLFYFAGNYFVVRELSFKMQLENLQMNDPYPSGSSEIPMAWLFYAFTLLTPIVYIVFSLLKKDKSLLWIGMLTLGFTVFTIRNYHHVLPTEIALTASGILMFAVAYFSIRKLKNKESGITFMADRFESSNTLLQLETIASAAQFGLKPEIKAPESNMEFGGGGFSGGGAGSEY
jgi:mannose/fructose/N-acetylgalactosamine-specific phosphotransferase system component IIC